MLASPPHMEPLVLPEQNVPSTTPPGPADHLAPTDDSTPAGNIAFIAVMGPTGAGKTTFINTATGTSKLEVSGDLESCTMEVQLSDPFVFQGRNVVFIDTPGFDDSDAERSDADILRMVSDYFTEVYRRKQTLAGLVYLKDISQIRMSGSACNNLRIFRKLCGDNSLQNVAIVTTMWGSVTPEEGLSRQSALENGDKYFGEMIKHGAVAFRHDNTAESAHRVMEHFFTRKPTELQIQRELVVDGKEFVQTQAAEELSRQLDKKAERIESRIVRLHEEAAEAAKEMDQQALRDAEEMIAKYEKELLRITNDKKKLRGGLVGAFFAGSAATIAVGIAITAVGTGRVSPGAVLRFLAGFAAMVK